MILFKFFKLAQSLLPGQNIFYKKVARTKNDINYYKTPSGVKYKTK
jgi:hypothetical protein